MQFSLVIQPKTCMFEMTVRIQPNSFYYQHTFEAQTLFDGIFINGYVELVLAVVQYVINLGPRV